MIPSWLLLWFLWGLAVSVVLIAAATAVVVLVDLKGGEE